jgi:hypothetical protein
VWLQEQFENFAKTVWEPLETVSDQRSSIVHFGGLNEIIFFFSSTSTVFDAL